MKKRTLIIAAVLLLVTCLSVATFAAWDTLFANKSLDITVGSNVNIKYIDNEDSTMPEEKVLVPTGAQFNSSNSNAVTEMNFGSFKIQNKAVNNVVATPGNGLKIKFSLEDVKFSHRAAVDDVDYSSIVSGFGLNTFKKYFKVIIYNEATPVLSSNDATYPELDLDVKYIVKVQFINSASTLDFATNTEVQALVNCKIKLTIRFDAVLVPLVP